MKREPTELHDQTFDLLIVGGGITGACLALDASNRGLRVALIEKGDFGAATSAASSKIIHGGARYLQQLRLDKVRESAFERAYFQTLAPHLTRYVPFLIPTFAGLTKGKALMQAGMAVYRATCAGQNRHIRYESKKIPPPSSLSRSEAREVLPEGMAKGVTGGVVLYESHAHSSERLTLAFLDAAVRRGAVVCNYVAAESLTTVADRVVGLVARDLESGESFDLRAAAVVNAAGPWIPLLNRSVVNGTGGIVTAYSRGAHILVPQIAERYAVALPTHNQNEAIINRGGRHVFAIPWRGHSLIGTSYAPHTDSLDGVRPKESDIRQLIDEVNAAAGTDLLSRESVKHTFAGIYPLVSDDVKPDTYQGTGDYQVVDHGRIDGRHGLYSVFGAKYTTARLLAEHALDQILPSLGRPAQPCRTRELVLECGDVGDPATFQRQLQAEAEGRVDAETAEHLGVNYGAFAREVLERVGGDGEAGRRVVPSQPMVTAEIDHIVEHESVCRLEDLVFRRTGLGTLGHPGRECLERVARRMAVGLGWSHERIGEELARTEDCYRVGIDT